MSDVVVAAPRLRTIGRRIGIGSVVVVGWLLGSALVGAITSALAPFALLVAIVLVPAGLVYGIVIRTVLLARRRRAGAEHAGAARPAPRFGPEVQRNDRWLSVLLLGIAALSAAFWIGAAVQDAAGYVSNNTSVLGNLMLAAGGLQVGFVVEALVAIPIAAVNVTRQVLDRGRLAEEAEVLAAEGPAARRIRTTRTLSWVAYAICSAAAMWVAIAFLPSILG